MNINSPVHVQKRPINANFSTTVLLFWKRVGLQHLASITTYYYINKQLFFG